MIEITESTITEAVPGTSHAVVAGFVAGLPEAMARFDITTERRVEHFLAQWAHESQHFTRLKENLNYSAKRMTEVWPNRFPTIASAKPYAKNPRALAIKTYGGRNGNRPGTEDGWTYCGRSVPMITGLEMYQAVGTLTGLPLVSQPELAEDPANSAMIAGAVWHIKGCNAMADRDDIVAITKAINGGRNGISDRIRYRKAFALTVTEGGIDPFWLKRGATGAPVEDFQRELGRLGYWVKVDGVYGKETEDAVIRFQRDHHIDDDGIAGRETMEAMAEAVPPENDKGVLHALKNSSVAQTGAVTAVGGAAEVARKASEATPGPDVSDVVEKVTDAGDKAREVGYAIDGFQTLLNVVWDYLPYAIGAAVVGLGVYIVLRSGWEIKVGKKRS